MHDPQTSPRRKRIRRSTEEIIDRLMEAAVEEFEEKGYSGATTAAIARRAGVAEALLFNHFGSKSQLFQDTIFAPLSRHFEALLSQHPFTPGDPTGWNAGARLYISELQEFVASHSRMLLTLVFAQCYQPPGVDGLAQVSALQEYFDRSARRAEANLDYRPKVDPRDMARISFVSIMACVLFQDWIFPDSEARKDEIRAAMIDFVMDGLSVNAPSE